MKTKCPHCGKEIEVAARATDAYGFTEDTKGSAIASMIKDNPGITLTQLLQKIDKKYSGENNAGRVLSVINAMKKRSFLVEKEGAFTVQVATKKA